MIVDASSPQDLRVVGQWEAGLPCKGVAAQGAYAYVGLIGQAYWGSNLRVIDVSNPALPKQVGQGSFTVPPPGAEEEEYSWARSDRIVVSGGNNGDVLSACELFDPKSSTWTTAAPMTVARYGHSAVGLADGRVLAVGGMLTGFTSTEIFDPVSGAWSNSASTQLPWRDGFRAALLPDGTVLVCGGFGSGNLLGSSAFELFRPAVGTWGQVGAMNTGRAHHALTVLPDGGLLATGGIFGFSTTASCEVFRADLLEWKPAPAMANPRWFHAATLLRDGRVLVSGGGEGVPIDGCEIYDPVSRTWSATGTMKRRRLGHSATVLLDGRVLVAGGIGFINGANAGEATCEIYNPGTGTWEFSKPLPGAWAYHSAVLLPDGDVLVLAGDSGGSPEADCFRFTPQLQQWTEEKPLLQERYFYTATTLSDGRILVTGGNDGGGAFSGCELRDPKTGAWSLAASLKVDRYFHTSTLLPDGRVVVTGGVGLNGSDLRSCEIYDPKKNAWTKAEAMSEPRSGHAAALLPGGDVIVVGGFQAQRSEIFSPATGRWSQLPPALSRRSGLTVTLLPTGRVLAAGGENGLNSVSSCLELDLSTSNIPRPAINKVNGFAAASVAVAPGSLLDIEGTGFRGNSEASGGTTQDSEHSVPIARLIRVGPEGSAGSSSPASGRMWTLPATGWESGKSLKAELPPASETPEGPYLLIPISAGVTGEGRLLLLDPDAQPHPEGGDAGPMPGEDADKNLSWCGAGASMPGRGGLLLLLLAVLAGTVMGCHSGFRAQAASKPLTHN